MFSSYRNHNKTLNLKGLWNVNCNVLSFLYSFWTFILFARYNFKWAFPVLNLAPYQLTTSLSLSLSLPPAHKMRYTELIIRFATLTNAIKSVIPSIKKQKREAQLQFWKPRWCQ